MRKFKNYLLFVAVLAIAGTIIGSQARAWKEPEKKILPVAINLPEIAKNPHALKNRSVVFIARFATRGSVFREKDEVFTPDQYENFSVWDKEVKFWNNAELKKTYPTLYIPREAKQLINTLRIVNQYDRIEVTGTVESLYANMPWIRVTDIRIIDDDDLDQPMASQITRAIRFVENNEFQKARICFEIAQERRTPRYVAELITSKLKEMNQVQKHQADESRRQTARNLLTHARELAKSGNFEKAATTYGKALKASSEYNSSADIHKEIAGFFIDFYRERNEESLLDYSTNEFNIAQKLIEQPDSDILYALAYIETLKARTSHDYQKAEILARKCLKINEHNYNGRKLLSEILSNQLCVKNTASRDDTDIILPVAPKKRIKLPKLEEEPEDKEILVEIEDLINEKKMKDLAAQTEKQSAPIAEETADADSFVDPAGQERKETVSIPGITADDFDIILDDIESNLTEVNLDSETISNSQNPELPDFPIDAAETNLPNLAL